MTSPWAEEPRQREPFFKLPPVILVLLAAMIAVQLVLMLLGPAQQEFIVNTFGFVPARYAPGGAARFSGGTPGLIWPFVTHLFLHGNLAHLFFNALWLMAVGTPLARRLGVAPFLVFYFLCGVASALAHLAGNVGSDVPVVGASGAISGSMAGALRLLLSTGGRELIENEGARRRRLVPISDPRLITVTIVWLLINAVAGAGFLPMPGQGGAGIAWEAHIGGFLAGLMLIPFFDRWSGGAPRVYPPL